MGRKNFTKLIAPPLLRCVTAVFLLLFLRQSDAIAMQDSLSVNLQGKKVTIASVFKTLQRQTGFIVFYSNSILNDQEKVDVNFVHAGVKQVMDYLVEGRGLTYKIKDRFILLRKETRKPAPVLPPSTVETEHAAINQDIQITGLVTDSSGSPLPGVTVFVKNAKSLGTTTDLHGQYILKVPDHATLVYSMVGFGQQEIPVEGKTVINVRLMPATTTLGEAVVVAFGKQKKEDVVGAVTSINPDELKVPSSNLTTALAGRLAGVIAYQRSGEPGEDNADFFIRGVTTFGYKKSPLILIDGIESTTTDLARLQPDNIANFSILKDATATALYGSRAANGVILIRTKEGQEGKAKIFARVENSVSMPTKNVQLADPVTYMKLADEAVLTREPLGTLPYTDEKIDNTIAGTNKYMYPATDWRKALIKNYTMNQRANLSVSGGGKVARYYVAGAISRDNGILKVDPRNNFNSNIKLTSYTLRSNVNVNITSSTEMAIRLSGTFDDYTGPISGGADLFGDIMRTNPVRFPAYYPVDADHIYVKHIMFGNYDDGSGNYYLNPYAELEKGYKNYSRSTMNAQFEVKQDLSFLTEGLDLNVMLNTQRYAYFDVTRAYNPFWYEATSYNRKENSYKLVLMNEDQGTEYLSYSPSPRTVQSSFYLQSTLNYSHTFNKKNDVNGLFVFMAQNRLTGNVTDLQSSLPFRNVGLAGRATYSYDHRYYAEFDFGYNASERFYKNHRWGFFPSVGVAWNISNEQFWQPFKGVVSNLKLRATYGLTGNDDIGSAEDRFLYLSNVNMNDADHGAVFGYDNAYSRSGISESRYSNTSITWETATKANLGMDLTLFGKWDITADVYKQVRSNILMTRTATPATMGLSVQPQANIGKAEGKGIDLSVDYKQSFARTLWLQARANFTYAASKFLIYEEYDYKNEPWKSHVGYSINQQWGYLAERLFVDDAEAAKSPLQSFGDYGGGDLKYYDVNNDGQITTLDQVPIGYPTSPEIVYGFGFSAGYKGFDISAFFQGLGRESFWIDANATAPFIDQHQLLKAYADDHWSEDNQNINALWPRLSTNSVGVDNNSQRSTWFMRNGAFLRLKELEIGYSLPQRSIERLYMKSLRIYLNTTNSLLWSKFKLWDVEMGGNGLGYPIQKVFNAGVQMNF
jgi:TonB-linked SusC/RagA family outer membrane protein